MKILQLYCVSIGTRFHPLLWGKIKFFHTSRELYFPASQTTIFSKKFGHLLIVQGLLPIRRFSLVRIFSFFFFCHPIFRYEVKCIRYPASPYFPPIQFTAIELNFHLQTANKLNSNAWCSHDIQNPRRRGY